MLRKSLYKIKINFIHTKNKKQSKENHQMRIFFLLAILSFSWFMGQAIKTSSKDVNAENIQEGIAGDIIRFHVIANSDSDEDQQLKYQVKDILVKSLSPYFKDVEDKSEAQDILIEKMPFIKDLAKQIILDKGYTYPVSVSLSSTYFPMKVYGDYTFPPGNYQALQVRIGNAEGKNWWCVMFPPLCFVDETYNIVDEDAEEKLEFLLTEEEFEALKSEETPIKIKFKLFELIKELFE